MKKLILKFFQIQNDLAGKHPIYTNFLFLIVAFGIPHFIFPEYLRWLSWPIVALLLLVYSVFLYKNRLVYQKLKPIFRYIGLFAFLLGIPCIVAFVFIVFTSKPYIDKIRPAEGFIGEQLEIIGSNFDSDEDINVVKFDGIKASVKHIREEKPMIIETNVPARLQPGSVDVTVSKKIFRVGHAKFNLIGKPYLNNFKPKKGFKSKGSFEGTRITITGKNFDKRRGKKDKNIVTIGDQVATVISVREIEDDLEEITVLVPEDVKEGPQKIVVETGGGSWGFDQSFIVLGKPKITCFKPKSGFKPKNKFPGTEVTVNGSNFDDVNKKNNTVKVGRIRAEIKEVTEGKLVFYVPADTIGGPITIETPADKVDSEEHFKIIDAPVMKRFSPWRAAADTVVTITGENFDGEIKENNDVKFGTVAATVDYVNSEGTQLKVKVPKRADDCKISVTTPADTVISEDIFQILPQITGFKPPGGPPGTKVRVYGYGFAKKCSVKIGNMPCEEVSEAEDYEGDERIISFRVPSGAQSGKITVAIDDKRAHTYDADFFRVHRKITESSLPPRYAYYPLLSEEPRKKYTTVTKRNEVIATDLSSGVDKIISVGIEPTDIAVHPVEKLAKAYVTNHGDNSISVIDVNSDIAVSTIPDVGSNPVRIKILGNFIHVLNEGIPQENLQGTLTSIYMNNYSQRYTTEVGFYPLDIIAVPKIGWIYVLSAGDPSKKQPGKITRILAEAPRRVQSKEMWMGPKRMVVGHEKGYITNFGNNTVSVINIYGYGDEIEVIKEIVLPGAAPFDIALHPKKPEAFVTETLLNAVAVIDTNKDSLIKQFPVGLHPRGIEFSSDGTLAFVVNSKDKTVSEIDVNAYKAVGDPIVLGGAENPVDIYIKGNHAIITDGERTHIIDIAVK